MLGGVDRVARCAVLRYYIVAGEGAHMSFRRQSDRIIFPRAASFMAFEVARLTGRVVLRARTQGLSARVAHLLLSASVEVISH